MINRARKLTAALARLHRTAKRRRVCAIQVARLSEPGVQVARLSEPGVLRGPVQRGGLPDEPSLLPTRRAESPSPLDIQMMRRALALADKAAFIGEVPIGAVIYRNNEIIAEAYNLRETHSDPTGHAELIAIRNAGRKLGTWRLNDCSMAVTLEPCPMCAGALVNARLGRLIYGAADPKAGACETLYQIPTDARLNHRVQTIAGVLADECRRQLQAFFRERRT